jgi:hypothetical protein
MSDQELMGIKDTSRLEKTLHTREVIIEHLMSGGVPEDPKDREFLIKALDGMDRTILTKAKIKSDDTAMTAQNNANKIIAEVLSRFSLIQNTNVRTTDINLAKEIQVNNRVIGETDIGVKNFSYDQIMSGNE